MDQVMTVAEMKKKFPSEWLLIDNPETDESLEVIRGKIAYHSKNRDEVYREASRQELKKFATLYTGQIPKDAAVVL